jgi:two-component system, OmpR family, KDP operon response regulator KdpE
MLAQSYEPVYLPETETIGIDIDKNILRSRKRILIVEDDPDTASLLKRILMLAGFDVSNCLNSIDALEKVQKIRPEVILLDLNMPEMDGWMFLQSLRRVTQIPVVILTANAVKDDIVRALSAGADDYMLKPFYGAEVIARIKNVLRRVNENENADRILFPQIDMYIDQRSQEVFIRGQNILLTPKEYGVLLVLARNAPSVVRYYSITREIWGETSSDAYKRTKYIVYLIRRKLKKALPDLELIQNVGRLGYRFQPTRQ